MSSTYNPFSSNYGYNFSSSDNGYVTLSNLIEFRNSSYDYKVRVYDVNNTSIYKEIIFYVNGTDNGNNNTSNGNLDNFYLTTTNNSPSVLQRTNLSIKARDYNNNTITNFDDLVKFKIYYGNASTNSWTYTTSDSYYTMNSSNYNTYGYDFSPSNYGYVTLSNFIEFNNRNYDYKVRVYDSNTPSIYTDIIYYVNGNSNGNSNGNNNSSTNYNTNNFLVSTDDSTPATYQQVDLTVQPRHDTTKDTTYRGNIQFEVYYKPSSSSVRTLTTSSSYYEIMNSTYEDNGYTFTSSNNGQKVFSNFIQFKKNNYSYKVLVYDRDYDTIEGYNTFSVGTTSSSSSVNGFSSSELSTVESIYNARDNVISNLENTYPILTNNSRRQTMSDDLNAAMQEIVNDDSSKTYDNFTDFYNAFLDRYQYTVSVRS